MLTPPPFVVANSGGAEEAPDGAIPINLFGAGTGGGGTSEVVSYVMQEDEMVHADPVFLRDPEVRFFRSGNVCQLSVSTRITNLWAEHEGDWNPSGMVLATSFPQGFTPVDGSTPYTERFDPVIKANVKFYDTSVFPDRDHTAVVQVSFDTFPDRPHATSTLGVSQMMYITMDSMPDTP